MLKNMKLVSGSSEEQIRILFTFMGLLTGFLCYFYYEYVGSLHKSEPIAFVPLFFLATFSNFFFMSYDRAHDKKAVLLSLGLSSLLSFFLFLKTNETLVNNGDAYLPVFMLFWVICQIALPLGISAIIQGMRHASYEILHRNAWNLPLLSLSAHFLCGLMWLILWLCSFMLAMVGIKLFLIILKPWFFIPFTSAIYGLGVAIAREKENTIAMLRDLILNLIRTTLPLLSVILIVISPIYIILSAGLIGAPENGNKIISLVYSSLSMIVLTITAINGVIAYDKNSASTSRINMFATKTGIFGIALGIFIPLFYDGAMIANFGLTPARLYGLIATVLLMLYAYAYLHAMTIHKKDTSGCFEAMRRHNIWISYIVLAVAIWLVSPLGNVNAIATAQQIHRLKSGQVTAEDFDFAALNRKFGKEGQDALVKLSADASLPDHEVIRKKIEDSKSSNYGQKKNELPVNVSIIPEETTLPDNLLATYYFNDCRTQEQRCHLLKFPKENKFLLYRDNTKFVEILSPRKNNPSWDQRRVMLDKPMDPSQLKNYTTKTKSYEVMVIDGQEIDPAKVN